MSHDPEDVRLRFGMDPPRLEETRHWEELAPGADELQHRLKVHKYERWARGFPPTESADDADENVSTFCQRCGLWTLPGQPCPHGGPRVESADDADGEA